MKDSPLHIKMYAQQKTALLYVISYSLVQTRKAGVPNQRMPCVSCGGQMY